MTTASDTPEPNIRLDRPLAFFDIESTGIVPRADRIIELAIVKLMPDGTRRSHLFRVNPGIPIPPETTAIHGIRDEDVADAPPFARIAAEVLAILADSDLAGYNVVRYDIPMLNEEFARAGVPFDPDAYRVVDVQRIFHRKEPRDLTAALAFYCGDTHTDAHGAEADTLATIRVLQAQLIRYPDLPRDVSGLDSFSNPRDPSWVDRAGRLCWRNGEIVINFGRKKGTALRALVRDDPNFLKWLLKSDFPKDVRDIVENAMAGKWPPAPPAPPPAGIIP